MKQVSVTIPSPFIWLPYAIVAVLVTAFLFFIDEGYNSLRWMADPGSWFVFPFYAGPMFALQLLCSQLLFRRYATRSRILLSIAGGVLTAVALVMLLFYSI